MGHPDVEVCAAVGGASNLGVVVTIKVRVVRAPERESAARHAQIPRGVIEVQPPSLGQGGAQLLGGQPLAGSLVGW